MAFVMYYLHCLFFFLFFFVLFLLILHGLIDLQGCKGRCMFLKHTVGSRVGIEVSLFIDLPIPSVHSFIQTCMRPFPCGSTKLVVLSKLAGAASYLLGN